MVYAILWPVFNNKVIKIFYALYLALWNAILEEQFKTEPMAFINLHNIIDK